MRPRYETEKDRQREAEVAELCCKRWSCEARKVPISYRYDYALFREVMVGILEIKIRSRKYDTLILSLDKVTHMMQAAQSAQVPALVVVAWGGAVEYTTLRNDRFDNNGMLDQYRIEWGGRDDRGDDQDQEPVVHISRGDFKDVCSTYGIRS